MSDPRFENIGDIITCTMEECAEVIHILCKVKRFGWNNWHPNDPNKTKNYELVTKEIRDLEKRLTQLKIEIKQQALLDKAIYHMSSEMADRG